MKTSCISTASAVFPEPSRLFGNKNKCMELFCLMLILNLGLRRWKGKDWLLDKPVAIKRKMVNKKNYFYDLIMSAIRHWNTWFLIMRYTGAAGPRKTSLDVQRPLSGIKLPLLVHKPVNQPWTGEKVGQDDHCTFLPSNGMILFYFSILSINYT